MGYTIYYTDNAQPNPQSINSFIKDAEKVLRAFKITTYYDIDLFYDNSELISQDYDKTYTANQSCLAYIGENDFILSGAHEDFRLPEEANDFVFTKTARKAYDIVCKVLYLLLQKHMGGVVTHDDENEDFLISCFKDGDVKEHDYAIALKLIENTCASYLENMKGIKIQGEC